MTIAPILVPVGIVTCMTAIIAEPGDRLMVINGVCIGVDTSQAKQQLALPAPKRRGKSKTKVKIPRKKRKVGSHASHAQVDARVARVTKALSITPMNLGELMRATKIPSSQLKTALVRLDKEGKLTPPEKTGIGNARTYQLRANQLQESP
jgi:hypothetical protein